MNIANQIISNAIKMGASDIHLEENSNIAVRVNSDIKISSQLLTSSDMDEIFDQILEEKEKEKFYSTGDLDTSISLEELSRIRINAFFADEKRCLTLRILANKIPKWDEIGLPMNFINLANLERGMILCTGPTGSGKSTSIAAFIQYILENQNRHIITIEDPIEYKFCNSGKSIIHQREVERDTKSFATALKASLREDPDVIYIGEMRDLETIQLAITAAETGHLVLGTLHTSSSAKTVERIVDVFPSDQQEQARLQASTSIAGIFSQTLCKNLSGKRSLAYEFMINNSAISNLIRERKINQIYSQIQMSNKEGMNTIDQCLFQLINEQKINLEEALSKTQNPKALNSLIGSN